MYTLIFTLYSLTFSVHNDEGSGLCPHGKMSAGAYGDVGATADPNG
jgi:hypothetical protein